MPSRSVHPSFGIVTLLLSCASTSGGGPLAPEDPANDAARSSTRGATVCSGVGCDPTAEAEGLLLPTNDDPPRQIRFATADGAAARRADLVTWIWGGPLPATLPISTTDVEMPSGMSGVDASEVARVDVVDVTVGGTELHSLSYILYPARPLDEGERVVIVHQGHANDFGGAGLGRATTELLRDGFTVVAMHMPLFGWNTWGRDQWISHGAMFDGVAESDMGKVFRIFLEPVVQTINHVTTALDDVRDVSMIGVSGGGWTTAMAAAIDPRLHVTVQVAGSAPLYVRATDPNDVGDREQFEASLYSEDIRFDGSGGGVATWLEIDALGGYGPGRRALQITNEFDPCCFAGNYPSSYSAIVADRVRMLGSGEWSYVLDSSSTQHEISAWALEAIIDPALTESDDE